MRHTFYIYPEETVGNKPMFFIEFSRWNEKDPLHWQLFKRNYMYSKEAWEKMLKECPESVPWLSRECHPWNLGEGVVNEIEGVVCMETLPFLKFMVDSMNKNYPQDE